MSTWLPVRVEGRGPWVRPNPFCIGILAKVTKASESPLQNWASSFVRRCNGTEPYLSKPSSPLFKCDTLQSICVAYAKYLFPTNAVDGINWATIWCSWASLMVRHKNKFLARKMSTEKKTGWYLVYPAPNSVARLYRFDWISGCTKIWWLGECLRLHT